MDRSDSLLSSVCSPQPQSGSAASFAWSPYHHLPLLPCKLCPAVGILRELTALPATSAARSPYHCLPLLPCRSGSCGR
jgi:hypothetical protein